MCKQSAILMDIFLNYILFQILKYPWNSVDEIYVKYKELL